MEAVNWLLKKLFWAVIVFDDVLFFCPSLSVEVWKYRRWNVDLGGGGVGQDWIVSSLLRWIPLIVVGFVVVDFGTFPEYFFSFSFVGQH
jgi:hypothetical protein